MRLRTLFYSLVAKKGLCMSKYYVELIHAITEYNQLLNQPHAYSPRSNHNPSLYHKWNENNYMTEIVPIVAILIFYYIFNIQMKRILGTRSNCDGTI